MYVAVAAVILYVYLKGNNPSTIYNGYASMVSDSQLAQTASTEQFSAIPYADGTDSNSNQVYSIAYGHQIQPGESFPDPVTPEQGRQLMLTDSANVVDVINNSGLQLSQSQFDGIWDFGYSAGIVPLQKVLATFQNNGLNAAASEMMAYVYWHPVPGGPAVLRQDLVTRRNNEVNSLNSY